MSWIQTAIEWYTYPICGLWGWLSNPIDWLGGNEPPMYFAVSLLLFGCFMAVTLWLAGRETQKPSGEPWNLSVAGFFVSVLAAVLMPLLVLVLLAVWPIGIAIYLGKCSVVCRCAECDRRIRSGEKYCPKCGKKAKGS